MKIKELFNWLSLSKEQDIHKVTELHEFIIREKIITESLISTLEVIDKTISDHLEENNLQS